MTDRIERAREHRDAEIRFLKSRLYFLDRQMENVRDRIEFLTAAALKEQP
jgi:hypothetical protein